MAGVEIAAISLAVVEQILKLGFLTTEIVRTAKDFNQVDSLPLRDSTVAS